MKKLVSLAAAIFLTCGTANAVELKSGTTIGGDAIAIEGDTISIEIKTIEGKPASTKNPLSAALFGIVAPKSIAPEVSGIEGWASKMTLDKLLTQDPSVTCVFIRARFMDYSVTCKTRKGDLGQAMLARGMATTRREQVLDSYKFFPKELFVAYITAEQQAWAACAGLYAAQPYCTNH